MIAWLLVVITCAVFHCGALVHPRVALVYVDRAPEAAITAGVEAIVEDGYLPVPAGQLVSVSEATLVHAWYGFKPFVTDSQIASLARQDADLTLVVLPDDVGAVPPDAACWGCLYTSSYHQALPDGRRYAAVSGQSREPLRWINYPEQQPLALYAATHELVEAAADAEIADPCADAPLVWWHGYALPAYRTGGACQGGPDD